MQNSNGKNRETSNQDLELVVVRHSDDRTPNKLQLTQKSQKSSLMYLPEGNEQSQYQGSPEGQAKQQFGQLDMLIVKGVSKEKEQLSRRTMSPQPQFIIKPQKKEPLKVSVFQGLTIQRPIDMTAKRTPSGFDPYTQQHTETEQSSPRESSKPHLRSEDRRNHTNNSRFVVTRNSPIIMEREVTKTNISGGKFTNLNTIMQDAVQRKSQERHEVTQTSQQTNQKLTQSFVSELNESPFQLHYQRQPMSSSIAYSTLRTKKNIMSHKSNDYSPEMENYQNDYGPFKTANEQSNNLGLYVKDALNYQNKQLQPKIAFKRSSDINFLKLSHRISNTSGKQNNRVSRSIIPKIGNLNQNTQLEIANSAHQSTNSYGIHAGNNRYAIYQNGQKRDENFNKANDKKQNLMKQSSQKSKLKTERAAANNQFNKSINQNTFLAGSSINNSAVNQEQDSKITINSTFQKTSVQPEPRSRHFDIGLHPISKTQDKDSAKNKNVKSNGQVSKGRPNAKKETTRENEMDSLRTDPLIQGKLTSTNISNSSNDDMIENNKHMAEIENVLDQYTENEAKNDDVNQGSPLNQLQSEQPIQSDRESINSSLQKQLLPVFIEQIQKQQLERLEQSRQQLNINISTDFDQAQMNNQSIYPQLNNQQDVANEQTGDLLSPHFIVDNQNYGQSTQDNQNGSITPRTFRIDIQPIHQDNPINDQATRKSFKYQTLQYPQELTRNEILEQDNNQQLVDKIQEQFPKIGRNQNPQYIETMTPSGKYFRTIQIKKERNMMQIVNQKNLDKIYDRLQQDRQRVSDIKRSSWCFEQKYIKEMEKIDKNQKAIEKYMRQKIDSGEQSTTVNTTSNQNNNRHKLNSTGGFSYKSVNLRGSLNSSFMPFRNSRISDAQHAQTALGFQQTQCFTPYQKPNKTFVQSFFNQQKEKSIHNSAFQYKLNDPINFGRSQKLQWVFMPQDQAQKQQVMQRQQRQQLVNQSFDNMVNQIQSSQETQNNQEIQGILKQKGMVRKGKVKDSVQLKIDELMANCEKHFDNVEFKNLGRKHDDDEVYDSQKTSQSEFIQNQNTIKEIKMINCDPNMPTSCFDRQAVKVSSIHLETLYNPKIEQVKYFEYRSQRTGTPLEMCFISNMDLSISNQPIDNHSDFDRENQYEQEQHSCETLQLIHQYQYGFSHYHHFDPKVKSKFYFSEFERLKMIKRIQRFEDNLREKQVTSNKATFQNNLRMPDVRSGQLDIEIVNDMIQQFTLLNDQMLSQRENSFFKFLLGPESDEDIRNQVQKKKKQNIEWLSKQFRHDKKVYHLTHSGYTFKSEGQQKFERQQLRQISKASVVTHVESAYSKQNLAKYLQYKKNEDDDAQGKQKQPSSIGGHVVPNSKVSKLAEKYHVDMNDPKQRLMALAVKLLEKQSALDFKLAIAGQNTSEKQANIRYQRIRKLTHDFYLQHQTPILVPKIEHLINSKKSRIYDLQSNLSADRAQVEDIVKLDRSILKRKVQEGALDSNANFDQIDQREIVIKRLRQSSADEVIKLRERIAERQRNLKKVQEQFEKDQEAKFKKGLFQKFTAGQHNNTDKQVDQRNSELLNQDLENDHQSGEVELDKNEVAQVRKIGEQQPLPSIEVSPLNQGSQQLNDQNILIKDQKQKFNSDILKNLIKLSSTGAKNKNQDHMEMNDQADDIQNLMGLKFKNLFNQQFGQKELGMMNNDELIQRLQWKN